MTANDQLARAQAELQAGRWAAARAGFEAVLRDGAESGDACAGLAAALWWLGDTRAGVRCATRAYALLRREGDVAGAVRCAVWLAITYKADFANWAAANGWIRRAQRVIGSLEPGPLAGWLDVVRAYRLTDLASAEVLTQGAADLARRVGDVDLELAALAQLGLIRVGRGALADGFALIDEAMAATLAGECSSLETVVYTCCDMLNACELASDLERAEQWCRVSDEFTATYGCPFLYAECRIAYGTVLFAAGRWTAAERELEAGLRASAASPALHERAGARLAVLRARQGRLGEAADLLAGAASRMHAGADASPETVVARAVVLLAGGDAAEAVRTLEPRLASLRAHPPLLASALDVLADVYVAAGDPAAAEDAVIAHLADAAGEGGPDRWRAMTLAVRGRVQAARGDPAAADVLGAAVAAWTDVGDPFEAGRARSDLGAATAALAPEAAIDHLRRALATFDDLGAGPATDLAAARLRSLGVHTRPGPKGLGSLTAREQQVLRLVGAGLSNPEIAGRLHISRKTAAHHVSRILTKLNARNRAEAAARAAAAAAGRTDETAGERV